MSNLWQRLLRATALVFGLLVGVGVTVFAYSNTAPVNVGWATLHFNAVPLWTVAVIPVALALAVGAVYHWFNNLHHFTEHMRHRRRVHELEAELASLRSHLDTALEMPSHDEVGATPIAEETSPTEPVAVNGEPELGEKPSRKPAAKKPKVVIDTEPVAVTTTATTEPAEPAEAEAPADT